MPAAVFRLRYREIFSELTTQNENLNYLEKDSNFFYRKIKKKVRKINKKILNEKFLKMIRI